MTKSNFDINDSTPKKAINKYLQILYELITETQMNDTAWIICEG